MGREGGREKGERLELLKLWACGWAQVLVLILYAMAILSTYQLVIYRTDNN